MKNLILSVLRRFHILGVLFLLGLFACPMPIPPKYPAPPDRPYDNSFPRWFAAVNSWKGHSKDELIDYWGGARTDKPCPPPEARGFWGGNICQPPYAPPILAGKATWFLSWTFWEERWSSGWLELERQPTLSGEPDPAYTRKVYACHINFWADENGIIIYGGEEYSSFSACNWLEENTAWLSAQYVPFAPELPAEKLKKKAK